MPKVLSFSSQVAYGHVGHSAGQFALQRLGVEVIALPTVILSNRPDRPHKSALRIEPERLTEMLASLQANGLLDGLDAVFTGYMPSVGHVEGIAACVSRLKRDLPDLRVMCDPILGDDPGGLYIPEDAATAIRDRLIPLADIVKPNRFELGWLRSATVDSLDSAIEAAIDLAPMVLVTSGAEPIGKLTNMLICQESGGWVTEVIRREQVPHGSGDFMAALFLGHLVLGRSAAEALAIATAGVEEVVEASLESDELRLVETQDRWASPAPWPLEELELFQ
jgi:pyridoxine kinase